MSYVPNTPAERAEMLLAAGMRCIEDLLTTIPQSVRLGRKLDIPAAKSELEVIHALETMADNNKPIIINRVQ